MDKNKVIRENIFATIAKLLALGQIKRDAPRVLNHLDGDAELQTAVQNFQHYSNQLNKLLPEYCKKRPNSAFCKQHKLTNNPKPGLKK